jgi:hypothetical protein
MYWTESARKIDLRNADKTATSVPPRRRIPVAPQTVITTKQIDRWPFQGIPAGERGVVLDIDDESGSILIQLDRYFESLRPWRNCIHVPRECRSEIRFYSH